MITRKKIIIEIPPCATDSIPSSVTRSRVPFEQVHNERAVNSNNPADLYSFERTPRERQKGDFHPRTPSERITPILVKEGLDLSKEEMRVRDENRERVRFGLPVRIPFIVNGKEDELVVDRHKYGQTWILHKGKRVCRGNIAKALKMIEQW